METPIFMNTSTIPFLELDIAPTAFSETGLENVKSKVHAAIIVAHCDEFLKATNACLDF